MANPPLVSFEIVHLISALSVRIDSVFKNCGFDALQMYVLAHIAAQGKTLGDNQLVLRDEMCKILKRTFRCSDDRVTDILTDIRHNDLIDDFPITKQQKQAAFGTHKGRRRVLSIKKKGVKTVELFISELRKLHTELIHPKSRLLCIPGSEEYGIVAKAIIFFLVSLQPTEVVKRRQPDRK
jgi:hypothetical protein